MLSPTRNPILNPQLSTAAVERSLKLLPHLTADRAITTRTRRHSVKDARKCASALEALPKLPDAGETIHLIISGRFALWHLAPAVHTLAGPIKSLRIATLGFSRDNIDELCAMIDANKIARARLLCSAYFRSTSNGIYEHAQEQFEKRPGRADFFAVRTHAKLLAFHLDDDRKFTIESSANLRSCHNIEQMTVIEGADAHDFHAAWIDELFARRPETAGANTAAQVPR